ncbi:hypothetical protein [Hafnia alvei]|uniref:hypothetical protein n=1 Tax=Hafnia alvei TaxID=569 RepID=UPI00345DB8F5
MRISYLFRCALLFMAVASSASWASQLEKHGSPQITEQVIALTSSDQISKEIAVGKIINQASGGFNGYIRLEWFDDDFSTTAKQVRQDLITKGITPERISLAYQGGGYRTQEASGIQVHIQKITLRLPECRYMTQNYKFDLYDDTGCAINNNLASSLVSPYKYYF